jgi:hypothetical protein
MEDEDFLNKLLSVVTEQMNLAASDFRDDIVRIKAEQSAQRFLLEMMYANAFMDDPDSLEAFEVASQSAKPTKLEPMTEEQVREGVMLTNLSLERFFLSVRLRIRDSKK